MTNDQLNAVFIKAHLHERNIIFRNMILIFLFILIIIGLTIHYSVFDSIVEQISNQNTDIGATDAINTYYKYIIPLVFIGICLYPFYLIFTLLRRPKKIGKVILALENGGKAAGLQQTTEYKTTIPIIYLKLRLNPVDYISFQLDNKIYKLPIFEAYLVEIKAVLSGGNIKNNYKIWNQIYNEVLTETIEKTELKPLSAFEEFAEKQELYSAITNIDAARNKAKYVYIFYAVIIFVLMGGYMFMNMFLAPKLAQEFEDPMMMTYIMVGLVFGITFFGYFFSKLVFGRKSNTKDDFANIKNRILKIILKFINPEFEYLEYGHVTKQDVLHSNLFIEKDYKVEGNDQIMGVHNGIPFQICDLTIHHTQAFSSERSGPNEVFLGQYFVAKFHKVIRKPIVIHSRIPFLKSFTTNDIEAYINDFDDKVKLDDAEFNKYFKVNCASQSFAEEILTPALRKQIIGFAEQNNGKIYMVLSGQQIVIATNSGKDKFETSLFTKLEKKWINGIYSYIHSQLSILNQLN